MNKYETECIETLQKLINIKSVKHDGEGSYVPSPGRPFGRGIAEALEYTLSRCESMGMRTKNCDGYAGYAEVGGGDEMIGILCHLDVVPEGSGWDYPPYGGEIHDGKLYGRGAVDDKGPAAAVIHAIKSLMDEGFDFPKRVRIIFGTDEECDWEDMDYYTAREECPAMGFTPDADFPLVYAEMGILQLDFVMEFQQENKLNITGGEASNAVPDTCRAWMEGQTSPLADEQGTAAHASVPWEGKNAISKTMNRLYGQMDQLAISQEMKRFIQFYEEKIGQDLHGQRLGCDFEDEDSGRLTFNAGKICADAQKASLSVDIRCPVTIGKQPVLDKLKAAAEEYGLSIEHIDYLKPVFSSCDSPLAATLLAVYREKTGDNSEPLTMGGGTYARAMDNIIAFGPLFPGREATEHKKNEYILVEDLLKLRDIYAEAIRRLCTGGSIFED